MELIIIKSLIGMICCFFQFLFGNIVKVTKIGKKYFSNIKSNTRMLFVRVKVEFAKREKEIVKTSKRIVGIIFRNKGSCQRQSDP